MSSKTNPADVVNVEQDGISVTKSLLLEEFPVPTVGFELTSTRDDVAKIRLRENIPDGYSMDAIGFHSEYESDNWTAFQDKRIEFEREIQPDETVVTIYGLRIDADGDTGAFMDEPEILEVTSIDEATEVDVEDADSVVDKERGEVLRDMIADSDAEAQAEAASEQDVSVDGTDATSGETATTTAVDIDNVAGQLAAELTEGDVAEADRETIMNELGLDLSASAEAQLRHLQTRVEDLHAYSEPVIDFLESGGPKRIEELDQRVGSLQGTTSQLQGTIESLDPEQIDELDQRVGSLQETTSQLQSTIESLDPEQIDELDQRVGSLQGTTSQLQATIESLEDELAETSHAIDETHDRLGKLESSIEDLDDEVDELTEWRDQLGEMFSG